MPTPDPGDLVLIGNVIGIATENAILSRQHTDARFWRDIPHGEIDRAVEAADRLVDTLGPDTLVPGMAGQSAAGLRIKVRYIANLAEPYRPKAKRA